MPSQPWILQFVLPNLALQDPIECEFVALVPNQDSRLDGLRTGASGQLLSCFEDPFGRQLQPAALLTRSLPGNQKPPLEALVAFRNAVTAAILAIQWSKAHQLGNGGVLYSDSFDLYPLTPASGNTQFIITSPAVQGMTRTNSFRGQCSPVLPYPPDHPLTCQDRTLLAPLLCQWRRRFVQRRKERKTTALFRSLAVAFQAARIPSEISLSPYDLGTRAVLWVSAFEILVHPGKGGQADLEKVLDLLSQAAWIRKRLKDRRFCITLKKKKRKATPCEKLYKQLYDARNNFAHGNPVNIHSILPFKKKKLPHLDSIAPLLYRAALGAYLNIKLPTDAINTSGPSLNAENLKYYFSQTAYEDGLLSIMQPKQ